MYYGATELTVKIFIFCNQSMSLDSVLPPIQDVARRLPLPTEDPAGTLALPPGDARINIPFEHIEPQITTTTIDDNIIYTISTYPRSRRTQPHVISVSLTSAIPKTRPFQRVGIIPYFEYKGIRHFFLCIDDNHKQITDPGGTPDPGEDFMTTGTRELYEETMKLFDFRSTEQKEFIYRNSVAMYNSSSLVMFLKVNVANPSDLCKDFRQRWWKARKDKVAHHLIENSHILWIAEHDLRLIVSQGRGGPGVKMPPDLAVLLRPVDPYPNASAERPRTTRTPDCYPTVFDKLRTILLVAFSVSKSLF